MNIAILGCGTVGSGIYEIITNSVPSVKVKHILDVRQIETEGVKQILTNDYNDILNDSSVSIVAEAMGGVEPAFSYARDALKVKKSVVTSNKELVAIHGAELMKTAKDNGVNFLFEASVGGGIPIIRTMKSSFEYEKVSEIKGVLNGTTNFILSQMTDNGLTYDDALNKARIEGFAESNPENDVMGYDTARKLAILISLVTGKYYDFSKIPTEGITEITLNDIESAKRDNCCIKLVAHAKILNPETLEISASVKPTLIKKTDSLFSVNNEFNAIILNSSYLGEVTFIGKGAGKLPTASAVVSDMLEIMKNDGKDISSYWTNDSLG